MTNADYVSYSKAHQAMGSYHEGKIFHMTNVENIGIETLVQRYELKYHAPNHIQFYSPASRAFIMRWFPAKVGVPWEMYVEPVTERSSTLYCLIGVDYPGPILKIAAWFSSLGGLFLKRHLRREGTSFARDLELKFKF